MSVIMEDLYIPTHTIPLAFLPRITSIFNPSYSYSEDEVIQVEDKIIEPSIYDEFARQTLWTTSNAVLSFRERKDRPHCESCVKNSDCVIVDPQFGYRCLPCFEKQILCSWRGEILVQSAMSEFELTRDESKALYERWCNSGGTDPDQDAEGEIDEEQLISEINATGTTVVQDFNVAKEPNDSNGEIWAVSQTDVVADDRTDDELIAESTTVTPVVQNFNVTEQPQRSDSEIAALLQDDVVMDDSSNVQSPEGAEKDDDDAAPDAMTEEEGCNDLVASGSGYISRSKRISKPSVKVLAVMEATSARVGRKRKRKINIQVPQSTVPAPSISTNKGKGKEREKPTQEAKKKTMKMDNENKEVQEKQVVNDGNRIGRKRDRKRARLEPTSTHLSEQLEVVQDFPAESTSAKDQGAEELKSLKSALASTISHPTLPGPPTSVQSTAPSRSVTVVLPSSTTQNRGLPPTVTVPYGSTPMQATFLPRMPPQKTLVEYAASQRRLSQSINNSILTKPNSAYRLLSVQKYEDPALSGSSPEEQYNNLHAQYMRLYADYAKSTGSCDSKDSIIETLQKELTETKTKVETLNESMSVLEKKVKEKETAIEEARQRQESIQKDANKKAQKASDLTKECQQLKHDNEEMHRHIQDMEHQLYYQHYHMQQLQLQRLQLQQFQQPLVIEDPTMVISALIGLSNQQMMLQAPPHAQLPPPAQTAQLVQPPPQAQQSQPASSSAPSSFSADIPQNIDPALFFPVFPPPRPPPFLTHRPAVVQSFSGAQNVSSRAPSPAQP